MVGEDAIEIDAVGIGSGQAWVEVEEMAVGLESGSGEQGEHFPVFDPAEGLAGLVGEGRISAERVAVVAVKKLFFPIDAVPCPKCSVAAVGQGDLVVVIPLVFREVAEQLGIGHEDGEVEAASG